MAVHLTPFGSGFFRAWTEALPWSGSERTRSQGERRVRPFPLPLGVATPSGVASVPAMPWRVASLRCPLHLGRKFSPVLRSGGWRMGCLHGLVRRCWLVCASGGSGSPVAPVGLHEHGVDLLEVDGFDMVAHGFDEG